MELNNRVDSRALMISLNRCFGRAISETSVSIQEVTNTSLRYLTRKDLRHNKGGACGGENY